MWGEARLWRRSQSVDPVTAGLTVVLASEAICSETEHLRSSSLNESLLASGVVHYTGAEEAGFTEVKPMHSFKMQLMAIDRHGQKKVLERTFVAASELEARRKALERAWASGFMVDCFLSISRSRPQAAE